MKTLPMNALAAAATLAVLAPTPAAAQQRPLSDPVVAAPNPEALFTSKDPKLNRNKQAALHIMRELLQCHEWSRAGEWLTDKYIQHNPVAASGLDSVVHYFVDIAKQKPTPTCGKLTSPVVAVQAEGDYVTISTVRTLPIPGSTSGETYTTTWFDMYRFVDGKADEHWDPMALGAGPGPSAAASKDKAPAASGSGSAESVSDRQADRAAIEALMWRYDRALDRFDTDKYVALFTPDGSFGETKGRAALRKMMSGFTGGASGAPKLQHATSNDWVEFTGPDSATIHYYWQTYALSKSGKLDDPPKLLAAGNGVDQVVKQDGQWLFKSRTVMAPND